MRLVSHFAGALIAAGFANFSPVAFHFRKAGLVSPSMLPIYYSIAMTSGAVGHRSESIYRQYAIADEQMLKESAIRLAALHLAEHNSVSSEAHRDA